MLKALKNKYLSIYYLLVLPAVVFGQRYNLPLKTRLTMPSPYFIEWSYKIDSLFSYKIPEGILNPCISQVTFSKALSMLEQLQCNRIGKAKFESYGFNTGEYSSMNHRWKMLGLRGTIEGKEVLVLDENFDYDMTNDSIYYLPKPVLNDTIPLYHNVYYKTDFKIDRDINYEFLHNDIVHKISEPLSFTVLVVYDSLSKSLAYADLFKMGCGDKLVFEDVLEGEEVNIQVVSSTTYPIIKSDFKITTSAGSCRKLLKEPIPIGASSFIIDSFDLIHKCLYLSNYRTPYDWASIKGTSISTDESFTFDLKSDVKLIHVWSTWCQPCIRNLPKLKELNQSLTNVSMLGICIGMNKTKAQEHVAKNNLDWPIMYFESKPDFFKNEMAVEAYPCYVVLDANNKILYKGSNLNQAQNQLEILSMKK
ncbi:MAG: TlpA family protein disulfide reductase [Saprospiraceae bacterium]|nr:TlpA family protein disulfide reductase [Saprospiraceae bacterium]